VVADGAWSTWTQRGIAIAMIALLTGINCVGLRAGKWVQNAFTALKALTLIALVALGCLFLREDSALLSGGWFAGRALVDGAWQPLSGGALAAGLGVAMVGSLFAADAWNNATFVAGEVRNPQRNVGLSLALGASAVILLYLLVNLAYLGTMTMDQIAMAPDQRVGAEMMRAILGAPGAVVLAIAVLVSTFGCNNGLILTGARLVWAMARDGLFFRAAGDLGAHSRVPVKALLIQGLWSCALVTTGSYSDLLDYVIFAALLFYVLTIAGLFVLRRTRPDAERPYRAWGYPVMPALYLLAAFVIMLALLVYKPGYTWPGLGIVVAGVPVYFGWRRWGKKAGGLRP
jgi:APA family basic amino acid/polyamine antiporter